MLVTAIEARPLRSLDRVRVELGPGHRQRRRAQRRRQDQPGRGALLRPHRSLLPHLRPPRPDPLRRLAGPRRGDGPRRRRPRAAPARFGQPHRGPPPPARRQGPPTRRRWPATDPPVAVFAPDRLSLIKGPPAERRAHLDGFARRPLAGSGRAAQALRAGAGPAQRPALALAAGFGAAGELDAWDASLAAAAAPLVAARDEAVERAAVPVRRRRRRARPGGGASLEYAPRAAGVGGGDPRRPRAAPRAGPAPRPQLLGPAPRRAEDQRRRPARCAATARRASSAPPSWPCSSPSARRCWRPAG